MTGCSPLSGKGSLEFIGSEVWTFSRADFLHMGAVRQAGGLAAERESGEYYSTILLLLKYQPTTTPYRAGGTFALALGHVGTESNASHCIHYMRLLMAGKSMKNMGKPVAMETGTGFANESCKLVH